MKDPGFSEQPCSTCGWRHQLDAFKPGDRVRVVSQHRSEGVRLANGAPPEIDWVGCIGVVMQWSQYGSPVWVRVQFDSDERENFDPCELEHVATQHPHQ